MHKLVALLLAGLTLHPALAEAAACKLDRATFRPRFTPQAFVLKGDRNGDDLLFDLVIQNTNEAFRFRIDVDEHTGEGTLTSIPDGAGRDPRIKTGFRLLDANGLKTTPRGEIGQISFLDLARGLIEFRLRERPNPEPYTSPPSGLWKVAECRAE